MLLTAHKKSKLLFTLLLILSSFLPLNCFDDFFRKQEEIARQEREARAKANASYQQELLRRIHASGGLSGLDRRNPNALANITNATKSAAHEWFNIYNTHAPAGYTPYTPARMILPPYMEPHRHLMGSKPNEPDIVTRMREEAQKRQRLQSFMDSKKSLADFTMPSRSTDSWGLAPAAGSGAGSGARGTNNPYGSKYRMPTVDYNDPDFRRGADAFAKSCSEWASSAWNWLWGNGNKKESLLKQMQQKQANNTPAVPSTTPAQTVLQATQRLVQAYQDHPDRKAELEAYQAQQKRIKQQEEAQRKRDDDQRQANLRAQAVTAPAAASRHAPTMTGALLAGALLAGTHQATGARPLSHTAHSSQQNHSNSHSGSSNSTSQAQHQAQTTTHNNAGQPAQTKSAADKAELYRPKIVNLAAGSGQVSAVRTAAQTPPNSQRSQQAHEVPPAVKGCWYDRETGTVVMFDNTTPQTASGTSNTSLAHNQKFVYDVATGNIMPKNANTPKTAIDVNTTLLTREDVLLNPKLQSENPQLISELNIPGSWHLLANETKAWVPKKPTDDEIRKDPKLIAAAYRQCPERARMLELPVPPAQPSQAPNYVLLSASAENPKPVPSNPNQPKAEPAKDAQKPSAQAASEKSQKEMEAFLNFKAPKDVADMASVSHESFRTDDLSHRSPFERRETDDERAQRLQGAQEELEKQEKRAKEYERHKAHLDAIKRSDTKPVDAQEEKRLADEKAQRDAQEAQERASKMLFPTKILDMSVDELLASPQYPRYIQYLEKALKNNNPRIQGPEMQAKIRELEQRGLLKNPLTQTAEQEKTKQKEEAQCSAQEEAQRTLEESQKLADKTRQEKQRAQEGLLRFQPKRDAEKIHATGLEQTRPSSGSNSLENLSAAKTPVKSQDSHSHASTNSLMPAPVTPPNSLATHQDAQQSKPDTPDAAAPTLPTVSVASNPAPSPAQPADEPVVDVRSYQHPQPTPDYTPSWRERLRTAISYLPSLPESGPARDALFRAMTPGISFIFNQAKDLASKNPVLAASAAGLLTAGTLYGHYGPSRPAVNNGKKLSHLTVQQIQEFTRAETQKALAVFKNNFANDLHLNALFTNASARAQADPHNAYTKACADAVESACMMSFHLKEQGYAQQAMALAHLADAFNLASTTQVKMDNYSPAFASMELEGTRRNIQEALHKAFSGIQAVGSATKEKFVTAYRNYKAQPNDAKLKELAVLGVGVVISAGSSVVSNLFMTAVAEHVAWVLTAENTVVGASGPIACSWEAIVNEASAVAPAQSALAPVEGSGQAALPTVAAAFQPPAVVQASMMAAHAQTIQSGANALAGAAASAAQVPTVPLTNQPINITHALQNIPQTCAGLDSSVGNIPKLQKAIEAFKDLPGAQGNDSPISKLLHNGQANAAPGKLTTARGAAYELEVAFDAMQRGEVVEGFATKEPLVNTLTNRVDRTLDIDIKLTNKYIECKKWDWTTKTSEKIGKVQNQLSSLQKLAIQNGKSFEFHSKNPLPETLKQWLNAKKISFYEG